MHIAIFFLANIANRPQTKIECARKIFAPFAEPIFVLALFIYYHEFGYPSHGSSCYQNNPIFVTIHF